jgi:hypothetical protein
MASMLKKVFAPLALCAAVVGLAGCGETPQDVAAKPAIIQQMVVNSLSVCQPGPIHGDSTAYAQRLTTMLSTAYTGSLKTLQDHHVTVCLDQRLETQKTDFWGGGSLDGAYYARAGGGVMTYDDNGKQPGESFWNNNPAYYRGDEAVDRLAEKLRNGEAPAQGIMQVQLWGKYRHAYWDNANMKPNSALSLNPRLQEPPVKAPAAKPGA